MKILISHFGVFMKSGWGRTFSLARGLSELGNDITLITTSPHFSLFIKRKIISGVHIIIFPDIFHYKLTSKGFGGLSLLLKLIYVSQKKFDIVHSDSGHRPSSGWPCLLNRLIYRSKYVAEWWDFFGKGGQLDNKPGLFKLLLGKFESWSELNDKRKADGIVVLSGYMKSRAIMLGINDEKITTVYGGADVSNIPLLKWANKRIINIENDKLVFGYIGMSDGEVEDLDPFLSAISDFDDRVVFVSYGEKLSKEYKAKYNLQNNFIEFGWIDYSKDSALFEVVDVFVLIKKDNDINKAGWPNKLGDYLACGRPVLLTPYGDVKSFSKEYSECFIQTTWSQKDIESRINDILQGKFDLHKMGKFARKVAENNISWSIKAQELETFYYKLIKG